MTKLADLRRRHACRDLRTAAMFFGVESWFGWLVAVAVGAVLGVGPAVVGTPVAVAESVPRIYWANNGFITTIGAANLDGTGVSQSFISGAKLPDGVAVDGQHIYWANEAADAIGEANLNGTGVNQSFITGADSPVGVAVDGRHIYWANSQQGDAGTIGEANLNGTGVNQSFIRAEFPEGVAVDGQHIYWADGRGNAIGEANLDGTGVNQSFIAVRFVPEGVAVDGQHIYWANSFKGTIGEANLNGTGVNQSFITGASTPQGVAVDGQHIYWANNTAYMGRATAAGTIGEANLNGTGVNQSFITGVGEPFGVAVSVPVAQLTPASPPPFALTPQGTLGQPVTLTLANAGQRGLSVSGLSFTGADAGDFVFAAVGCFGTVAPGETCQLTVRFAPQAPGARSATLQIATNDYANNPLQVPLSGTGGQRPHRPAGKIELAACHQTTKTATTDGHKHKITVQRCSTRLVFGTVKFTTASGGVGASVSRAHTVYATGLAVPTGPGDWQLVLNDKRILHAGRYTLTLTTRHGRKRTLERRTITIT